MKTRYILATLMAILILAIVVPSCKPSAPEEQTAQTSTSSTSDQTTQTSTTGTTTAATTPTSSTPQYGGSLRTTSTVDPLDFDQAYKTAWQSWTLDVTNEPLVDPLWTAGPAGSKELLLQAYPWYPKEYLTGSLLSDWELETPTKWILHVRPGVYFQNKAPVNGREMIAGDVAVSINRMLTQPGSWLAAVLNKPVVTVKDKYTLTLEFQSFDISWEYRLMDTVFIVAKESVIDAAGNETQGLRDWKNSVGTGAWILTDWVKGSSVSFSKNPNYWGYDPFHPENRLPYIDRITTFIIPDASTSLAAFRTGKIDTRNVTLMDAPSLMQINPDIKHIEMYANYSLELHMRTELEPFSDQKVRQALSIAINRDVIIKDLFQGHGNYLNRFFNPNDIALYVPFEKLPANLQGLFTYNPDKARQMLKEAGYPNGFTTSVLVSATDTTSLDAITLIKADWEKIGVKLNIDSRESAVTTSIRYGRTFEGLTIWGYGNAYAWTCPDVFASGHYSNISGVKDTWWDTARARVVGLSDATARNALGTEMNFYSLEKMWVIPLPTPNSYEMWWPWVKQWEGSFMSGTYHYFRPFRQAWLDQSLKNKLQP